MGKKAKGLNDKQKRFCREYVIDHNATQAAIRAKYSKKTAHVQGPRLLGNVRVQQEIARLEATVAKKLDKTAGDVLRELALLGFSNMMDYMQFTAAGDPVVDFSALTRDQAAAIQEVIVDEYVEGRGDNAREVKRVKFKLADKRQALVDLGKYFGLFVERHEHGVDDELGRLIAQLREGTNGNGNGRSRLLPSDTDRLAAWESRQ
jgi:phage terminase small subunit